MAHSKLPLGRNTDFPDKYAPQLLCAIARADSRARLGLTATLPFSGSDVWNAWDLTWLGTGGVPRVATGMIRIPAESPNIVESKSLKLYLNSFSMSEFASADEVAGIIGNDLGKCVGSECDVVLQSLDSTEARQVSRLAGRCLDGIDLNCSDWKVDAGVLRADDSTVVCEDLHTHLLRSLCPVTAQPDLGSLLISYRGPKIDEASLLRYIVSFRRHSDFHEACVERMFVDILSHCAPESLSLHARYQRRGGLDINPYRSSGQERQANLRLWRQ